MKTLGLLVAFVTLSGCTETSTPVPQIEKSIAPNSAEKLERFNVESQGEFYAGYGGNRREILIVTDKTTGQQYLGITGCGVTELHTETRGSGKTTHTVTVEE